MMTPPPVNNRTMCIGRTFLGLTNPVGAQWFYASKATATAGWQKATGGRAEATQQAPPKQADEAASQTGTPKPAKATAEPAIGLAPAERATWSAPAEPATLHKHTL